MLARRLFDASCSGLTKIIHSSALEIEKRERKRQKDKERHQRNKEAKLAAQAARMAKQSSQSRPSTSKTSQPSPPDPPPVDSTPADAPKSSLQAHSPQTHSRSHWNMFSEGSDLSDLSDTEEIESAPPQSLPEGPGSVAEMEDEEESSERGHGVILDEKPPVIGEPLPTGTLGERVRNKALRLIDLLTLLLCPH